MAKNIWPGYPLPGFKAMSSNRMTNLERDERGNLNFKMVPSNILSFIKSVNSAIHNLPKFKESTQVRNACNMIIIQKIPPLSIYYCNLVICIYYTIAVEDIGINLKNFADHVRTSSLPKNLPCPSILAYLRTLRVESIPYFAKNCAASSLTGQINPKNAPYK